MLKEVTEQVGVLEEARQKDLENVSNRKAALQELTAKEVFASFSFPSLSLSLSLSFSLSPYLSLSPPFPSHYYHIDLFCACR
jgi:hypothetical protein